MVDASAITEASEKIKTLAKQLATEGAKCPAHAKIVEITSQIASQADTILQWSFATYNSGVAPPIDGSQP